jgi:hypothetical protein
VIDAALLLADLRREVTRLEDDLRERAGTDDEVRETIASEYARAKEAGRTALGRDDWREELLTQGAVAWVLGCVFVRFLEDTGLLDDPWLSGPGDRRGVARGRRQVHFQDHPADTDREYLRAAFRAAARFPAVAPLFDERHNLAWRLPISGDAASELVDFWARLDAEAEEEGRLRHDFSDERRSTRFLGDLYQDLSDEAKKRYALLQTPEFVESFILDRTLEPALEEFGLPAVRMIDPTCGSGHFLIGAFERLFTRWQDAEPGTNAPALAQKALDAVHGVDINPFAVAIARFRLLVAALVACGTHRLADAHGFTMQVACGDSLLHGPRDGQFHGFGPAAHRRGIEHHFLTEDVEEVDAILSRGYHAVVGNPPYIVARDRALNDAYRERYKSCKGKYSLAVPFMERFFELAAPKGPNGSPVAGFVGKITANSFMKREFGTALVEDYLPGRDVQTLVDASGAYIPGHGTPTVLLFGRMRDPRLADLRVVDGVRGEPRPPDDPARGLVWRSIVDHVDQPGTENGYVRSSDVAREEFAAHPMTLGVGRDLRKRLESGGIRQRDVIADIGVFGIPSTDELLLRDRADWQRSNSASEYLRDLVLGDAVRDWRVNAVETAWFPYDGSALQPVAEAALRALWRGRTVLWERQTFDRLSYKQEGRPWYEWHQVTLQRLRTPLTITFGEVATHNHFVLDRGGKVFKQTAPVIKLPAEAGEEEHLALLGVLNSSTACFWLKQVCQTKGAHLAQSRTREERYAFNASNVADLPLPAHRPPAIPTALDRLARERADLLADPGALLAGGREALDEAARRDGEHFARMVSLQEELDWQVLASFGLVDADVPVPGEQAPALALGERAFEIVLARRVARDEAETTWFARHGSTPITELPDHWPADYHDIVQRRIALIESDRDIGLIERPEGKRRWNQDPWEVRERRALRGWLLDRLEALDLFGEGRFVTAAQLADALRDDERARLAAARYAGRADAQLEAVVEELVLEEAVPHLAAQRLKDPGLRKHAAWERTWDLQRAEDAIDALTELDEDDPRHLSADRAEARKRAEVGDIAVPPKYAQADFRRPGFWKLRGKLDVPKERFVLVPDGGRPGDPSPVVGWAGWDHARLALALANHVGVLRTRDGADATRLAPLLAGVLELLPWVAQWHPDPDPDSAQPLAADLEDFLTDELAQLSLTRDDLRAWRPPAPTRGRRASGS